MISNCDLTLDCERLLASSRDSVVFVFDVKTGETLCRVSECGPILFAEWNRKPGQQTMFVISQDQFADKSKRSIKIYEDHGDGTYDGKLLIDKVNSKCLRVHWGPYDETLISGHENGNICVWCATTGDLLKEIKAHEEAVACMSFTEDRLLMLTCSGDMTGKLFETIGMETIKTYKTDRPLNSCDISPIWDRMGSPKPHVLFGGGQKASAVTTTTATEGKFQPLLYHMIHGHMICSINKMHYSPINTIAFAPNGLGFASGAEEGLVRCTEFDDEYDKIEA